ncbi:MAG: glycosyltransferase family 4 protein [Alphaproteobacteria bacterium]|nr:glycosyltransferase family 4 protein [Alphaproteobacteria bacterium]
MKVLFLTRYGRLGASSRQRCFLYLAAFRAAGIRTDLHPLLDDNYLRDFYGGRATSAKYILRSYAVRLAALLRTRRYDLVWIEKEVLPWLPAWIELLFLKAAGTKFVVDYDDAIFHAYDRHRNRFVRKLLGSKIDRIMAAADAVTVGNSYLGLRAKSAGARHVGALPTVVDLRRYSLCRPGPVSGERPFTLGWIGTPVTSPYLELLRPALAELGSRLPFRFVLVGAPAGALNGIPVERVAWSAQTEAAELARCDVGVMPLPDLPWERGKCGYKLIQYMASSLPVVASPVGVNREIVIPGETGFLAAADAEWVSSLLRLAQEPELRQRMGTAGRRRVKEHYSLEVGAPKLIELLYNVCGSSPRRRGIPASPDAVQGAAARHGPVS